MKTGMRSVLLLAVLLCVGMAQASGIYRWVDEHGVVHFSDEPGGAAAEEITVNPMVLPMVPENARGRSGAAAGAAGGQLIMYSAEWCGYCTRARNYFRRNNIPFLEKDIEKSAQARREHEAAGGRGVPLLVRGDARMNGFSEERFESWYRR
ncbi:MAG: glutaredoxin family protein [Alcanivorax sp.]|nr:glutaredoxin family protein [Alcanivorax sp.]